MRHPSLLYERNALEYTTLHLAAAQPDILRLLVSVADDNIINLFDYQGHTALMHAIMMNKDSCYLITESAAPQGSGSFRCPCTRSAEILLDADCAILHAFSGYYFGMMMENATPCCRAVYFAGLKDRRERLKKLAVELLDELDIEALELRNGSILDARAAQVVQKLEQRNIKIPAALQVETRAFKPWLHPYRSIYHMISRIQLADELFQQGYRDIDVIDNLGLTPLVCVNLHCHRPLQYMIWLIEHGADPFRLLQPTLRTMSDLGATGITPAHYCFRVLGASLGDPARWEACDIDDEELNAVRKLNRLVLVENLNIACTCTCLSGRGCGPFDVMLQAFHGGEPPKTLTSAIMMVWYFKQFGADLQRKYLFSSIRFLTHLRLEIAHTCNYDGTRKYTDEEIQDLQDEQSQTIDLLEDLVQEFNAKADMISQVDMTDSTALESFWMDVWQARMEEVLESRKGDSLTEEERTEAEKLGVVWAQSAEIEEEEERNPLSIAYYLEMLERIVPE
jgi:hypothetical protein